GRTITGLLKPAYPLSAYPAEHPRPGNCQCDAQHRGGDHRRNHAFVFGDRRSTGDAFLGCDARCGCGLSAGGPASLHRRGNCHLVGGAWLQFFGRRAERSLRCSELEFLSGLWSVEVWMSANEALKKIVGSLLVVGFEGPRVTESLNNFLEQWELGGVILFKRNVESFEQVRELNAAIYRLAKHPLIGSVDHDGGRVFRLAEPFTAFPPMRYVGRHCERSGDAVAAERVGRVFARELRAAGFNLDYAPVLDVDSNPENPIIGDRAFAPEPEAVADSALAFL